MRIALITLGEPTRLTGGYLYHLRLSEIAPRQGSSIDFLSFPDWPFPLPLLAAPWVWSQIQALKPHAVLLDSIAAAFLGPWLPLLKPFPPLLSILHQSPGGIDHGPLRAAIQARLDAMAYRRSRCLLAASQALAEELRSAGYPRVEVVAPGRDVAEGQGASVELRQGRRAAFLCVGNWVRRKDILSLLQAFAALPPDRATLHLVGDEGAEPDYQREVEARLALPDLHGRVMRHGKLSRPQVASMYAAADVFVLPSLREPYGTVYGEAMAAGLPVVGWSVGNLPHLARHEVHGLLLNPGDVEGLRQALLRLADDEVVRLRLARAARAQAQSFPTWEETTAAVLTAVGRECP